MNPSFGGSSFNSAHLFATAEPDRPDPPENNIFGFNDDEFSQADAFVQQLEARILSRLSSDIADAIFGPDAEPSGEFVFETTVIGFESNLDGGVTITITDTTAPAGGETVITVPGFLAQVSQ